MTRDRQRAWIAASGVLCGVGLIAGAAAPVEVRSPVTDAPALVGPRDAARTRVAPGTRADARSDARAGESFVNWENPPLAPLAITPDGTRLLLANLPTATLDVYDLTGPVPRRVGSVPVGLDPVTVRARSNTEAWVVNHISDSVSIVDLAAMTVKATLPTLDEPYDLVFAGDPQRAFVSCSQANAVQVFDPAAPGSPPATIPIDAEDPRALGVSPDGMTVYAAVFESGNATTILGGGIDEDLLGTLAYPPNAVSHPDGPYAGVNPPPNSGSEFFPPQREGNPPPPKVGLIVRKGADARWTDDNAADWTDFVTGPLAPESGRPVGWDMPDRDVAVIDTTTLGVSYITGLMNINMALAVHPATGRVTVVGTEAINHVRFEPNVASIFVRVHFASVDPADPADRVIADLNPHLGDYSARILPQPERDKSIGDPRGVVWNAAGTRGYVSGMGSNNVVVIDADGQRAGLAPTIEVGAGATGLALDEPRGRLYVLNRFDRSISVVDLASEVEIARVAVHDATPPFIHVGRRHLYDTHATSGLGQTSCAGCHVDARMDRLAWDLGDPSGVVLPLGGNNLGAGIIGLEPGTADPEFEDFHPMKGPMATQTLQGIIGLEPHHWRGDRTGIEGFNGAFVTLNGDDATLTPAQMQEFEDFLASITFPPNPFRNFDNTLPTDLPLPGHYRSGRFGPAGDPLPNGSAAQGMALYRSLSRRLDGMAFACVTCHTLPTGASTDRTWNGTKFVGIPPGPDGENHLMLVSVDGSTNRAIKTPQLRNMYEKVGFEATQLSSRAGFGVLHDGSVDSLARFVSEPAFNVRSDKEVADLVAFLLCFSGSDLPAGNENNLLLPPGPPSKDSHAAVGRQVTIADYDTAPPDVQTLLNTMILLADAGPRVALIAKGLIGGEARGYAYRPGGTFQPDRAGEPPIGSVAFLQLAQPGAEITFTMVPEGTQDRLGLDRDEDGWFDRDELDVCADPADPDLYPGSAGSIDVNADLFVDTLDVLEFLNLFSASDPRADFDRNGFINSLDVIAFLGAFNAKC